MKRCREITGTVLLTVGFVFVGYGLFIPAKAVLAQVLLERAWMAAPKDGKVPKPWPWADTKPIARIKVDDLDVSEIILAGAHGRSLPFGPGHVDGTSEPGRPGHSVIAAHRDTHFSFLENIKIGMAVSVELPGGQSSSYVVVDMRVLDTRSETIVIDHTTNMLSLVTCFPFNDWNPGGPMRYVVTAVSV